MDFTFDSLFTALHPLQGGLDGLGDLGQVEVEAAIFATSSDLERELEVLDEAETFQTPNVEYNGKKTSKKSRVL